MNFRLPLKEYVLLMHDNSSPPITSIEKTNKKTEQKVLLYLPKLFTNNHLFLRILKQSRVKIA